MSRTKGHNLGSRHTYRKEHPSHSSNKTRKQIYNKKCRLHTKINLSKIASYADVDDHIDDYIEDFEYDSLKY